MRVTGTREVSSLRIKSIPRKEILAAYMGRLHPETTAEDLSADLTEQGVKSETFKSYMPRLTMLLRYNLQSRKVDDFDSLFQLLICDKVKASLSENVFSHVLRSEVTLDTQWADVIKLADILDTYQANYDRFDKPKAIVLGAVSNASRGGQYNMANTNFYPRDKSVSSVSVANAAKPDVGEPRDLADTVCFKCGKRGHVRAKCLSNAVQGSNKSAGNEHA